MKKPTIILTLAIAIAIAVSFASCNNDKDPKSEPQKPKTFKINPSAPVKIKPAKGTILKAPALYSTENPQHLTALEIVKQTEGMMSINTAGESGGIGFAKELRDTVSETPCLKMYAMDIIDMEGNFVSYFIESSDITFRREIGIDKYDTIAYTPNKVVRRAERLVKKALADKDTVAVYELFDKAFTFIPITGAEWRDMKAKGLNENVE